MMRFTWLSNSPWTPTGYGQQTALFTPRITSAGHPVAVISTYGHQGSPINWQNVQVFGSSFHPYGMDIMHGHSKTFQADALITLIDAQVMELEGLQGTPWIPYFPVDHDTIPPAIFNRISQSFHPITMSKHASFEMDKTGIEYSYVPLAYDAEIFKPLDQMASREALGFDADKFIVGMVAMNKGNPSRKAFHQNIAAFAALQKKHGDCLLYLHTMDGVRNGFEAQDLVTYCATLGLKIGYAFTPSAKEADVIFADQYGMALGYDPKMMAQIYSALDVHCGVTMGEGFGIPIIEAQACGCPVIVGNWTSMPELVFSGWKVDKSDAEPIFTNLGAFQFLPRAAAIADKLEMAYTMRGNYDYRKRAHDGVRNYEVNKVMDKYWLPALAKIEAKLKDRKPTDNLSLNLAVLR
jgi:glycosyltransferase involved in cell wall biosynthesis